MCVINFAWLKLIIEYPNILLRYPSKSQPKEASILFKPTVLAYHRDIFLGVMCIMISAVQPESFWAIFIDFGWSFQFHLEAQLRGPFTIDCFDKFLLIS